MLPRSLLLLCVVGAVVQHAAADDNVVSVPKDLMRFILGCQRLDASSDGAVPVYSVDIDGKGGTTSQKFGLLKMDELGHALRQTVDSEAVVGQIMAQVRDAVTASSSGLKDQGHCNVENKINISIPAKEVNEFGDKMQQVSNQNNFLLLEQINNLIKFKLRQHTEDLEKIMRRKMKQIDEKLDAILLAVGIEVTPDDDDDTEASTEGPDESSESIAPEAEPEPEPEPEPKPGCNCKNKTHTDTDSSLEVIAESEPETEPEPKPESQQEQTTLRPMQESEPSSENASAEAQDSTSETTKATPEPQQQPESEPQTEASTTFTPRPTITTTTTLGPASIVESSDSDSDEISNASDNDDDEGSSSDPLRGFERVAQQPSQFYSSMPLLRPLMRRPPITMDESLSVIHHRERVPLA